MTIALLAIVMLVYWLGAAIHGRSVPTREAAELESRTSICESLAVTSSLLIQESKFPLPQDYISQMMARNPKFRSIGLRNGIGKLVVSTPNHESVWADPDLSDKDRFQPGLFSGNRRWGQLECTFKAKTPVWISSDLFPAIFLLCGTAFGFLLYLGSKMNVTRPPKSMPNEDQSALDLLGGGLMVLNKSGQIVNANEAFALSCGCNVKDVVGKHPEKVSRWLAVDGTPLKNPPWEHTIKTGERVYEDVVGMVVNNSTGTEDKLTFKVNCAPVKSHLSNDNCVLVSLANVTELAKSKLAAEDTNTANSDFLANMSHEIRKPMNAILGFSDWLQWGKAKSPEEQHEYLATIHSSGSHLLRLISGILDHSKIEAEKIGDGKQTEKVSTETNTKQQLEHKSQVKEPKLPELTGGTVLVVDDGDANRKLINLVLTRAGFVVTEAVNGKIGSDLALERDFDLILMDMRMPVMDGYKATGRLRENGYKGPIMALTANTMSGDREVCLAVGCNDFLAKPVNIDELLKTVPKYLSPQAQSSLNEKKMADASPALASTGAVAPTTPADSATTESRHVEATVEFPATTEATPPAETTPAEASSESENTPENDAAKLRKEEVTNSLSRLLSETSHSPASRVALPSDITAQDQSSESKDSLQSPTQPTTVDTSDFLKADTQSQTDSPAQATPVATQPAATETVEATEDVEASKAQSLDFLKSLGIDSKELGLSSEASAQNNETPVQENTTPDLTQPSQEGSPSSALPSADEIIASATAMGSVAALGSVAVTDSDSVDTAEVVAEEESSEPVAEPKKAESVADVLARMQNVGSLNSFSMDGPTEEASPEPVASVVTEAAAPKPQVSETIVADAAMESESGGDEDGSVEDYMSKLLNRMRSGDESEEADDKGSDSAKPTPQKEVPTKTEIVETSSAPGQPQETLTAEQFVPKQKAVRMKSFDSLREIANNSNRLAIQDHLANQRKVSTQTKMQLALIGFGFGILFFLMSCVFTSQISIAGIICGIAFFVCGLGFGKLYRDEQKLDASIIQAQKEKG